ncbi:MAG: helix-turn-helix transcriptional regulator [Clostridia bacterium]|nr:helix-turn-helix transcriptional regulator [Clostridia bacterium]
MKFNYLKLAEIIKTRRNELGISTRKLAEKIGISHAEISRFENGLKPSFYFIPFVKMCKELDLDLMDLLIEVGLLDETTDKKYIVKVTNVDDDFFEIEARNEKEAATIVGNFIINNDIIEINTDKPIDFEVEEIQEEIDDENSDKDKELDAESFMKMQCENCEYYCPYCGECTFGE